jgi:hypothetical protein
VARRNHKSYAKAPEWFMTAAGLFAADIEAESVDTYNIVTKQQTMENARILRSSSSGFILFVDGKQKWSHFLRQPANVDSTMQRTIHHEDAETVFGGVQGQGRT